MYISCLVTIVQALLSVGSDGHVWPRYYYRYKGIFTQSLAFEILSDSLFKEILELN